MRSNPGTQSRMETRNSITCKLSWTVELPWSCKTHLCASLPLQRRAVQHFSAMDTTFFDEKSNLRSVSVLGDRHHVFDEGLRDNKSNLCFATVLGDRHHVCDKRVVRRQISNLRFATVLGDQHHVCDESVVQRQKMNPIIFQGKPCHKSYHERTRIS